MQDMDTDDLSFGVYNPVLAHARFPVQAELDLFIVLGG
jgi:hypothetical protein